MGDGLLMGAGVHRTYLARHLFGPVRDIHAVLDVPGREGETFAGATLRFQSGALGILEANHCGPPGTFDDEIEIVGSDAILRLGGIESLSFGYRDGPALTMFRDPAAVGPGTVHDRASSGLPGAVVNNWCGLAVRFT